jgi:peptidase E
MNSESQFIVMGGGGFSMLPENLSLDRYILQQTQTTTPKICFISTASGDSDAYVTSFYRAYSKLDCEPSHLPLFRRTPEIRPLLLKQDVIYVGGGNTKSMLAVWRDWGLDLVLKEALENGILLSGISAGAICWFEQGVTDSYAENLEVLDCLGWLKGSCCPHYDGEPERRPSYHRMLAENRILPGFAIDDCAAIHFRRNEIHRVISAREGANVYRVRNVNGRVHEDVLQQVEAV